MTDRDLGPSRSRLRAAAERSGRWLAVTSTVSTCRGITAHPRWWFLPRQASRLRRARPPGQPCGLPIGLPTAPHRPTGRSSGQEPAGWRRPSYWPPQRRGTPPRCRAFRSKQDACRPRGKPVVETGQEQLPRKGASGPGEQLADPAGWCPFPLGGGDGGRSRVGVVEHRRPHIIWQVAIEGEGPADLRLPVTGQEFVHLTRGKNDEGDTRHDHAYRRTGQFGGRSRSRGLSGPWLWRRGGGLTAMQVGHGDPHGSRAGDGGGAAGGWPGWSPRRTGWCRPGWSR
jgi:hypothetical protein